MPGVKSLNQIMELVSVQIYAIYPEEILFKKTEQSNLQLNQVKKRTREDVEAYHSKMAYLLEGGCRCCADKTHKSYCQYLHSILLGDP